MAIPIGTTSRQLATWARWLLVGLLVVASMAWWWPGFMNWGAMIGGLLAVWVLWMLREVAHGEYSGVGNPMQAVLAILAVITAYHVFPLVKASPGSLGRGIDLSVLTCLGILSLGMILCQELLTVAAKPRIPLFVLGLAMMAGPILGEMMSFSQPLRPTLTMLGFCGICVWLCACLEPVQTQPPQSLGRWRLLGMLPALLVAAVLAARAPIDSAMCVLLAAAVAMLVLAVRKKGLVRWLCLAALVLPGVVIAPWVVKELGRYSATFGPLGLGEEALGFLPNFGETGPLATASGLACLGAMLGWIALVSLIGGFVACLIWLTVRSRTDGAIMPLRMLLWPAASVLALAAMLRPGGLFVPATAAAAAVTWGMLPHMLQASMKPSRSWVVVAVAIALLGLLGMVPNVGLANWSVSSFGGSHKTLHALTGFLTTIMLAWLVGGRKVRWGLVAFAIAVAFGGAGELGQEYLSPRGGDLQDFFTHAGGGLVALVLYLLCIFSRWAESPDAKKIKYEAYDIR
jgi:hypothetical protein